MLIAGIASTSELALVVGPSRSRQLLDLVARSEWASPTGESWVRGSLETLLAHDPDVLVIGTWDPPGGYDALFAELAEHPLWNELAAVRNDRVIFIPDYTNPTPHSLVGARVMLDELVPRIYPERFPDGPLSEAAVQRVLER